MKRKRVIVGCGVISIAVLCVTSIYLYFPKTSADSVDVANNREENVENTENDKYNVTGENNKYDSEIKEHDIIDDSDNDIRTSIELAFEDVDAADDSEENNIEGDDKNADEDEGVENKVYTANTKLTEEDLNDVAKLNEMVLGLAKEHEEIMVMGSKVDSLAQSMGISTKEVGSSTVNSLTVDDEPYYSILQSVNAVGYYWVICGDITDTMHLFYTSQDGEVVYYGLIDLWAYR